MPLSCIQIFHFGIDFDEKIEGMEHIRLLCLLGLLSSLRFISMPSGTLHLYENTGKVSRVFLYQTKSGPE